MHVHRYIYPSKCILCFTYVNVMLTQDLGSDGVLCLYRERVSSTVAYAAPAFKQRCQPSFLAWHV